MATQFRVAVVGCGAISPLHVKGILNAGQNLCALCDILPERAEKIKEASGLSETRVYTDYLAMLDTEKPDAVHICTPHHLHAPMVVAALEREIHVLCEKPIAINEEQLAELHRAVGASHAQLGVCHQNRYEPNMLRLKELCRDGVRAAFGTVVWQRNESYYRSAAWRGTLKEEGGGVMINQALHTLDILQWISGFPKSVVAHVYNDSLKGVIEVEDTATACFECESGARLHFFATNASTADFPVQLRVQLQNGGLIDAQNAQLCQDYEVLSSTKLDATLGKRVWGDGHRALIADFYRCIGAGERFSIDLNESEKVIKLIRAMYRSAGEKIEI